MQYIKLYKEYNELGIKKEKVLITPVIYIERCGDIFVPVISVFVMNEVDIPTCVYMLSNDPYVVKRHGYVVDTISDKYLDVMIKITNAWKSESPNRSVNVSY